MGETEGGSKAGEEVSSGGVTSDDESCVCVSCREREYTLKEKESSFSMVGLGAEK